MAAETRIYSINVRGVLYKLGEIGDINERVTTLENGEVTIKKKVNSIEDSLSNLFVYDSSTGALTIDLDAL